MWFRSLFRLFKFFICARISVGRDYCKLCIILKELWLWSFKFSNFLIFFCFAQKLSEKCWSSLSLLLFAVVMPWKNIFMYSPRLCSPHFHFHLKFFMLSLSKFKWIVTFSLTHSRLPTATSLWLDSIATNVQKRRIFLHVVVVSFIYFFFT